MKIQTLSGVGIKGKHFDQFMIIDVDEEDAGICVGSGKARFVVNEEIAREENAKMRAAAGMEPLPGDDPVPVGGKSIPKSGKKPTLDGDA